ncbi:hypothetical protein I6E81_06600 [Salinibacterium sp. NG22]|uniref:hypothetical protein n=1 Tax=Salinibacterium sp. NG22 TaxID=2792040 RepID=UPI0018CFA80C|nr:hypothetical protein [Salinibacterium sp. NG22]MBH0109832.1 hypothetical protein [Salinibacterium sp. NG22]
MNFRRRIVSALAALSLLAPALAGCSSLSDDAADLDGAGLVASYEEFLAESTTELKEIEGIGEVSQAPISGVMWESPVMIDVEVSEEFAEAQTVAVVETLRRVSDGYPSYGIPVAFTIRVAGESAGRFRVAGLGLYPDFVISNFNYWRALEQAFGAELTMVLLTDAYDEASYSRIIGPGNGAVSRETIAHMLIKYDALATVSSEQSSGGIGVAAAQGRKYEMWALPGLNASNHLPPRDVIELVAALGRSFPLQENAWLGLDYDYPAALAAAGALVQWIDNEAALHGREVAVNSAEYRDDEWPAIVAAAAGTAQVTGFDFGYASPEREFRFHTSPCEGTIEQTADDELLFAALREGGLASLEDLAPGRCVPNYPQSR